MRCLVAARRRGRRERIVEDDDKLDALETETERRAVQLIALRAPMAGRPSRRRRRAQDRRRRRAHRRLCQEHRQARCRCSRMPAQIEPLSLLPEMARIATEMVHDVLDAFVERDAEAAVRVCERDDAVDDFYEFHLPHAAHLHDGKPAQHRPVGAPAVRRQEPRADRRPRHQHRRDGLLRRDRRAHGRPASRVADTGRSDNDQAPAPASRTTGRLPTSLDLPFRARGLRRHAHRRRRRSA